MPFWWEEPFRVFQTNIREIDAVMDVRKMLADIKSFGANTWLLNTAGIVSFYPSRLPYQHPSPWLRERASGDLIGDAVEEAHRQGVRLISRIDFSKLHPDVFEQHLDWFYVSPQGRYQVYNGLYSTCPSGPYYQEKALEIIDEVLERYPVDGFFFNMFTFAERDYSGVYWGICQCANCQRRFREATGMTLPREPNMRDPAYLEHLEYKRRTLQELAGRIRRHIRQRRPDACLMLRWDPDVAMNEVNNAVDRPMPLWRYWPGDWSKAVKGQDLAKPAVTNVVLFLDIPYRFSMEQPGLTQIYGAQVLAHGVNPWIYVVGTTDQPDRKNFAAGGDILRFHRDHEDLFRGSQLAPWVAVVSSQKSEERYGRDKGNELVVKAYRGVYRALVEEHIPFVVIPDTALPEKQRSGELARYRCIVLPNVAALSDEEAEALDAYVRAGGGLVATFESGLYDAQGNGRAGFALQCLGGLRVLARRENMRSAYLRVTDRADLPGFDLTDTVVVDRAFLYVGPGPGQSPSMRLIPPSRYGPPEKTYWDVETDFPGIVHGGYGSGRVAYFPWQLDALFHDLSLPEHKRLLAAAVERVSRGGRQLTGGLPPQVEAVVAEQPAQGRVLVHLINYSGHQDRSFFPPCEFRDLTLRLGERKVRRARSAMLNADLPVAADGTVTLPTLGWMDVLVLSG